METTENEPIIRCSQCKYLAAFRRSKAMSLRQLFYPMPIKSGYCNKKGKRIEVAYADGCKDGQKRA